MPSPQIAFEGGEGRGNRWGPGNGIRKWGELRTKCKLGARKLPSETEPQNGYIACAFTAKSAQIATLLLSLWGVELDRKAA